MKAWFLSIFCAVFLLSTVAVDAANFEITSGSSLEVGGPSRHKQETFTATVTLRNNFLSEYSIRLEDIRPVFISRNNFQQSGVIVGTISNLEPNASSDPITITIRPGDFDIVEGEDLEERGQIEIGTLKFTATSTPINGSLAFPQEQTQEISLKLELKNDLDLISVEYQREGGSFSSVGADSTITINVDEDIDLRFKVRNTFESSSAIEFENINIKIESPDLNIEKTTTISEILAGAQGEKTTTVSADEIGSGEVKVYVTGDDEFGGKHGELFVFNFNVEEAEEEEDPVDENDADGDGVPDNRDECLNTVSVCDVDAAGCPLDSDEDGTCDALDPTPQPVTQQASNDEIDTSSGNDDRPLEDATARTKKEPEEESSTAGFIPFLIGFAVGILVTAGFSVLIKS